MRVETSWKQFYIVKANRNGCQQQHKTVIGNRRNIRATATTTNRREHVSTTCCTLYKATLSHNIQDMTYIHEYIYTYIHTYTLTHLLTYTLTNNNKMHWLLCSYIHTYMEPAYKPPAPPLKPSCPAVVACNIAGALLCLWLWLFLTIRVVVDSLHSCRINSSSFVLWSCASLYSLTPLWMACICSFFVLVFFLDRLSAFGNSIRFCCFCLFPWRFVLILRLYFQFSLLLSVCPPNFVIVCF